MRIRTIKPEFWEDEVTTSLSRDARLLFIATFNNADDEGLLRWSPEKLKAAAFMYDDDISMSDVARLMDEVVAANLIHPYIGKGSSRLAWIVNFHRHQRINRPQPSKLTAPSLQNAKVGRVYAQRDGWVCHLCDGPVNRTPFIATDPYSPTSGPDISSLNASLDHVAPKSKGGTDYPSNIRLAHVGCNKGRANRDISDFSVPRSVAFALSNVLTSTDEDSVICVGPLTEDAVNDHGSLTHVLPPEGEREGEGEKESKLLSDESDDLGTDPIDPSPLDRFGEFWDTFGNKVKRPDAERKWVKALAKPGVTADLLISSAASFVAWERANNEGGRFIGHPSTWLHNERWTDEPKRVQNAAAAQPRSVHTIRRAPSGMTPREYAEWEANNRAVGQ